MFELKHVNVKIKHSVKESIISFVNSLIKTSPFFIKYSVLQVGIHCLRSSCIMAKKWHGGR